jgi:SAM-dependent methyltransferase
MNIVEKFWSKHIVGNSRKCKTKAELLNKIRFRFDLYPNYDILMGLHDDFEKKRVLDFGCGPGWDLSWIALTDTPSRIVGIDVSKKALDIAKHHLELARRHDARFILCSDTVQSIDTIGEYDIIISSGVLHHVTYPADDLAMLRGNMHKKSELRVMVYNKDSIFCKVYVPSLDGVFEHHVDGGICPIARCYTPEEFIGLCESVELKARFIGSYHDPREVPYLDEYGGRYGGLGGVYRITRR